MAKQTLNNGDTKLVYRTKTNENFTELYDQKAPLASPTFTGTPLVPTASYGTNTTQAASTQYVRTEVDTRLAALVQLFKYRNVRVSSTANITIGSFSVASPIDGVTLVIGDKLLLRHQSTASQNGIYFVNPIGGLSRAEDGDAWNEYPGSLVSVNEGTANADTRWYCTSNDGGTLGTTAITYVDATSGSGVSDGDKGDVVVSGSGTVWTVEKGLAHVFASFFDVTGVKAGDIVTIVGDKSYRATGPSSFVALVADPTFHQHDGANITAGTVSPARLGSGSSITTKFLRGDSTWQDVPAGATGPTGPAGPGMTVREIDGSPSVAATTIEFTNGTVTDQGGGVVRVTSLGSGLGEPLVMPPTAMAALAIDYTKFVNTKTISADSMMTFVAGTPATGARTELRVTNTHSSAVTLTIPSSYSLARNALITTVLIPANATISLAFEYTGARWEVYGDPVGSITRSVQLTAFDYGTDVAAGDGAAYFVVPSALNGMSLVSCSAYVIVAGTTGSTTVQITRIRSGTPVSMLSTLMSIDTTETGSNDAAIPEVINASNDDVATHDRIRIDVPAVSTTAPRGLIVVLNFEVL